MSCQIKKIANLTNISDIKRILFRESFATSDISEDELPIQDCFISMSSIGDVLAMAHKKILIILISRLDLLDPGEIENKFHMTWHEEISTEQVERITSVICLPVNENKAKTSSSINSDWTCIIVGFSTGFIHFYTETGTLLLEVLLHHEPVLGLKCQSLRSPKHIGDISLREEVHVIYGSIVCVLQGNTLFPALRAIRNHLAEVKADYYDIAPTYPLLCKEWSYETRDIVNDSEVIGTTSVNSFDHLMTVSLCSGYKASYRSSAPQHSLVIATGKRPFVGFHYALEGGSAPVLSDVALAMTTELANAIGNVVSWRSNWGYSKQETVGESSKTIASASVEPMFCRFGLSDIKREGYSIISSPNKALSVVLDAMGRVLLIDNRRGIAMRMWKGYRDAQCGWIEVEEEEHCGMQKVSSSQLRSVLFLVIYAPKKGLIDIWSAQQGPKITTFTASKHGRLLYINYGLFGVNNNVHLSRKRPQYSCIFMDPLGSLKEITVPFYFAIKSESRKKARDVYLLKKLKSLLQEEKFSFTECTELDNVLSDFRTDEIKVQVIKMLMTNKNVLPCILLRATKCFLKKLDEYEAEQMKSTAKALYLLTTQVQQVTRFYSRTVFQLHTSTNNSLSLNDNDNELSSGSLSSILLISEKEVHRIFDLFDKVNHYKGSNSRTECKVKFEESRNTFADFLSCFEFGTPGLIGIKQDISTERTHHISQILYEGCIYSCDGLATWKEAAMASNIQPFVFMEFALINWLNTKEHTCLEVELKQYTQLFRTICSIANIEDMCPDYNERSLWWNKVRNILSLSTNPFNALSAAVMCRAVAVSIEKFKESSYSKAEDNNDHGRIDNEDVNDVQEVKTQRDYATIEKPDDEIYNLTNEWENLTNDSCQLTLLIGNLEDITILDAIVSQQPPSDDSTQFFALPLVKFDISLGFILSKGKGSVSEIVAKWIVSTGIDPAQLVDTTDAEFDNVQLTTDSLDTLNVIDKKSNVNVSQCDFKNSFSLSSEGRSEEKSGTNASSCILERIKLLKLYFPYSLTSSVLLANICWEFVMSWNKDISQLEPLAAALSVLRYIPMQHMKNGICMMLWSIYLKKPMEAIAKLINKLGKLPKERLCIQEVGISDIQTVAFLKNCVAFFEIFIGVNLPDVIEIGTNAAIKSEELWEGFTSGPQPFAALAITQAPACYDLIILHVQLANVLYMMAHFNIKQHKPLNTLFDPWAQQSFFQIMPDREILPLCQCDKSLRTKFLRRVITASMDFIYRDATNDKVISLNQAIEWMSRCQTLASIWKINNDELRIHQVCQLYINGLDRLAEEVISTVNDVEGLAADLLPIAGKRLMAYVSKKPDLLEDFSRISPALTRYLEALDVTEVSCTCCSNDDTTELIRRVSRHLPETHSFYYIVPLMLDAVYICE